MVKRKIVKAIFKFPESIDSLLTDGRAFYKAITTPPGSTLVTIDPAEMATAQLHMNTLGTDQVATKTGAKGTAVTRNLSETVVVNDIRDFVRIVQKAADNAPDEATAIKIVITCGLVTQEPKVVNKDDWEVRNHEGIAGVLDFISKAVKKGLAATYEVQESTDDKAYTPAKASPESRTTYLHGQPSGTKMYYRRRIVLSDKKGGQQTWSQSFWLYVL